MNPVPLNLQSLKDDIVGFKQEFSQLKSETSSCPHKLTLQCLQCLPRCSQSSIELSEDPYETFERFKAHLTDSEHEKHVHNLKSFRIHCTSCNGDLVLQNCYSACQNSIIGHLKSTKHETVYRAVVSNALSSLTSRFMALQGHVKELDGRLDGIIGKFEMIETGRKEPVEEPEGGKTAATEPNQVATKPEYVLPQDVTSKPESVLPEAVSSKPEYVLPQAVTSKPESVLPAAVTSKPQPAVKYPSNATIICNVCKVAVSSSRHPGGILGNVFTHLQGNNHQLNIQKTADRSIWCCLCRFSVLISADSTSSIEIMKTHIYGCRHSPDEEEGEDVTIICNACECSISPDYWSWQDEDELLLDIVMDHLDNPMHYDNMTFAINQSIWCAKCDCDVSISYNRNFSLSSIQEHIYGSEHSRSNEESKEEHTRSQTIEDEMEDDSSVIICNVCDTLVACSYDPEWKDNDLIISSLMSHLEDDEQHNHYLMVTRRKRSLWCSKCNYPIPISEDLQSSQENISNHINTLRHSRRN